MSASESEDESDNEGEKSRKRHNRRRRSPSYSGDVVEDGKRHKRKHRKDKEDLTQNSPLPRGASPLGSGMRLKKSMMRDWSTKRMKG